MDKIIPSESGVSKLRVILALALCSIGTAFAFITFKAPQSATHRGPMLRTMKTEFPARPVAQRMQQRQPNIIAPPPSGITFGHPVISGIGGTGFEQAIRIDPSNPNRIYTSTPGTLSADTSWIWRSLDAGKTFKWVPNALALEGKVTSCHGGGDTELAVDGQGRLYFNDLTLANFSTARSDDFGATFVCNNTAVPSVVVDRQWYAIDGDPLNGGTIYLTNDEVGQGAPLCGETPANNVLVVYRSPVDPLAGATAGIAFGPPNRITGEDGCNEGIMGNIEVSPVATTLGQPLAGGGYAVLPQPVKHVFIPHDDAKLQKNYMARCFPVAFGPAFANVSDPSGLNCTDILIHDPGPNVKTGGDFPTMDIDKAGNLYVVWEEAPIAGGVINGDVVLKYSFSTDQGNTWKLPPITIDTSGSPVGTLHQNVFAWINAGDDGRVNIAWYGTDGTAAGGPDKCTNCLWYLFMAQSVNAHDANPVFTPPVLASEHHIHKGSVQTLIGGQDVNASRALGDFLQMRVGADGEAHISYADSNRLFGVAVSHGMYVRQNGGQGLYAAKSPVSIPDLTPFNFVTDPSGDARYEATLVPGGVPIISNSMPQLDILRSSVVKVTTSPCSVLAPCYRFKMEINNLSLAPSTAEDPDPGLVWLTQWFVPSGSDPDGGKNYHVYAEAFSDGTNPPALQCYLGESTNLLVGGGATITYTGNDPALPANNCQMSPGQNGSISIYVPISMVTVPGAVDDKLHEVTASTMTLPARGNSNPNIVGLGGVLFNLIDVVQGYVFDPTLVQAVSRKTHGTGSTFDLELPLTGTVGVEPRRNTAADTGPNAGADHRVIVTFPTPVVTIAGSNVTSSDGGALASSTGNGEVVTVLLHNLSNEQRITINLTGVVTGTGTSDVHIPMDLLEGDTNADDRVNVVDTNQTKSNAGQLTKGDNFRTDPNLDGRINVGDTGLVKNHAGDCIGTGCQ